MDPQFTVRVKRASVLDATEFLKLEARCFQMTFSQNTLYYWRPIIDYAWAFKAIHNGKIVGGAIAMPTRNERIYINSLFVDSRLRRRGIATRLLLTALKIRPKAEYILDTNKAKPHLREFYEKHGFHMSRIRGNYYLDGTSRLLMIRKPKPV